ncbi:hypothetical protein K8I31_18550, partial [bacterium]|nr:hypothetical protein [bacterium]
IVTQEAIKNVESIFLKYDVVKGCNYTLFWSDNGDDWRQLELPDAKPLDGKFVAQWGFSPRAGFIIEGPTTKPSTFSEATVEYRVK